MACPTLEGEVTRIMSRIHVRWQGNYQTSITIRGIHHLQGDEAPEYGGQDAGPMPTDLLLAGVASCMCLAVSHVARKRRIALENLTVEASASKDEQAFRFGLIELMVKADLPQDQLDRLVDQAKRYCFVSNTLIAGCPVQTTARSTVTSEQTDGP